MISEQTLKELKKSDELQNYNLVIIENDEDDEQGQSRPRIFIFPSLLQLFKYVFMVEEEVLNHIISEEFSINNAKYIPALEKLAEEIGCENEFNKCMTDESKEAYMLSSLREAYCIRDTGLSQKVYYVSKCHEQNMYGVPNTLFEIDSNGVSELFVLERKG